MAKDRIDNKSRLTQRNIASSIMLLLINIVVLALIVFVCLALNQGSVLFDYIIANYSNMFVVCGAIAILSLIVYFYFYFEDKKILKKPSKQVELYLLMYISIIISIVIGKFVSINARPAAFFALMAAMLFGRRNASFLNVIYALLMFLIDTFTDITFATIDSVAIAESTAGLLTVFCSGMVGIFISKKLKTRAQCVMLAFILFIPMVIITSMILSTSSSNLSETLNLLMFTALGSIFSTMLFIFVLPLFESVFAELTVFRLREFTSDDAKLIRLLKKNAMGTYNHSVTVAQFAEACAREIGEDSELARAAAYYHDMGKLKSPDMFTENQKGHNPHNELTPELSVAIIRSHTTDGANLIKKQRLPEFFADVAIQHHGTMPIKYFYAKALNMSDREIRMERYSYPGPTPTTKIAAIIMIADSCEAAARSMPDRSPEKVEALIRNIIEERLDMDQFDNCNITMRDLTIIKETLVQQISGVYHTRIAYPKLKVSKNNK